ncbi:hypothetical protein [Nostoc sp.]
MLVKLGFQENHKNASHQLFRDSSSSLFIGQFGGGYYSSDRPNYVPFYR